MTAPSPEDLKEFFQRLRYLETENQALRDQVVSLGGIPCTAMPGPVGVPEASNPERSRDDYDLPPHDGVAVKGPP